jgi:hypothetical protein
MNYDHTTREESILSVGDRVRAVKSDTSGKIIRIHFDSGEIVVMDDHHGAEHRYPPQDIRKVTTHG